MWNVLISFIHLQVLYVEREKEGEEEEEKNPFNIIFNEQNNEKHFSKFHRFPNSAICT